MIPFVERLLVWSTKRSRNDLPFRMIFACEPFALFLQIWISNSTGSGGIPHRRDAGGPAGDLGANRERHEGHFRSDPGAARRRRNRAHAVQL